jgi:hypothetical protein
VSGNDTTGGRQCDTGPLLTVVIPVLHDAAVLEQLLDAQVSPDEQWVVVNGDAADHDMVLLRSRFPAVQWIDSPPGRGPQQNAGARLARGTWLLFLHADTRLPAGWRAEVAATHRAASNLWGCFRLGIDSDAWQARAIEWCVRARVALCALPYGDQGLLVRRDVFDRVGLPALSLDGGRRAGPRARPSGEAAAHGPAGPHIRSPVGARRVVASQHPQPRAARALSAGRSARDAGSRV